MRPVECYTGCVFRDQIELDVSANLRFCWDVRNILVFQKTVLLRQLKVIFLSSLMIFVIVRVVQLFESLAQIVYVL